MSLGLYLKKNTLKPITFSLLWLIHVRISWYYRHWSKSILYIWLFCPNAALAQYCCKLTNISLKGWSWYWCFGKRDHTLYSFSVWANAQYHKSRPDLFQSSLQVKAAAGCVCYIIRQVNKGKTIQFDGLNQNTVSLCAERTWHEVVISCRVRCY